MSVDAEAVASIAHLARLAIDDDAIPAYASQLSNVLDLVEQMNQVDTDGVAPMAHPMDDAVQRLREDSVSETNQREQLQAPAPAVEEGLFLVPRVIE